MKRYIKRYIKQAWHWIVLLLSMDIMFIFVTWLIRRDAMRYLSLFIFLFTALIFAAGYAAQLHRGRKDEGALLSFLETPENRTKEILLERFGESEVIHTLCTQFLLEQSLVNEKTVELAEYREYIEAWVHEAKTPLSLSALVLNNHRDEISPYVYARMNYVQHQLTEDIERILYYARLQAEHPDILFTRFRLDDCVLEVLDEYRALAEEKRISFNLDLEQPEVVSDRKIVSFMLSQLISNAVKYADSSSGKISLSIRREGGEIHLGIYNNGEGVPPEDMPFIFDRGFTGSCPNRQKATGMGLYLVRKYAEKLCVQVRSDPHIPYESGFGIEVVFVL